MILLDTHIWIWWANNSPELGQRERDILQRHQTSGLAVSIISCWELAKLVELQRLHLAMPVENWMLRSLQALQIQTLDLTPHIAVSSTQLPQPFHKDPADQMIVAISRVLNIPLLTADRKILDYLHVQTL
jgi:PIN domain nuclease of toxin-antitoxin system